MPSDISKKKFSEVVVINGLERNPDLPDEEFEVEYVYGYRSFDCR